MGYVFGNDLKRARIALDEHCCFVVFLLGFAVGSKGHLALSAFGAGEELTWNAFDIRSGHSFMGSILGAVGFMLMYVKYHRVSILPFLDVLLPCCMLGHVIGKFGCFFSGDGCYGRPADPALVPWAMSFPNAIVSTTVPVHPTPLYEAAMSFTTFALARLLLPLPHEDDGEKTAAAYKPGRRTALVLVLWGLGRYFVERFRRHPPIQVFLGLTEYQALAVTLFLVGFCLEVRARLVAPSVGAATKASTTQSKKKKRA